MCKQIRIQRLNGRCTPTVVLLGFLIVCGGELRAAALVKLSPQGYSPLTKTLLIRSTNRSDLEGRSFLLIYDEVSRSAKRVAVPGNRALFDVAWVPGRPAFVVTDLEQVILFQKDTSGDSYTPALIQCLGGALPSHCSWSPGGQWLAVNCLSQANVTRGALWLCRFGDEALRDTGVALDYRPLAWGNESLLYGTKDNSVLAIKLTGERASVARTVPLWGELSVFYGMLGEQPLTLSDRQILRLGEKMVVPLVDYRSAKFRVMATEKIIFASVSSGYLGAFDTAGNEIARSSPGRLIEFGSLKDPNTVYGLADSSLVCLSVAEGTLKSQTVADLEKVKQIGPDR